MALRRRLNCELAGWLGGAVQRRRGRSHQPGDYRAQGGLAALQKALREMSPSQVLEAVKASKLVGRGGAAYPAGLKWQNAVATPDRAT